MDILFANIGRFFDPLLFGVVLGGVLVMAWIQNGRASLFQSFLALAKCSRDPFADSGENATYMCRRIDFVLREDGIAGLERVNSQDVFIKRVITRLLNAKDAKSFEEWVRLQEHAVEKKQNVPATFWNSASEIAPAIGLIGTIIGLIQLFATGIDPLKMGPAMSFTLLTSLYGLFVSHIIAHPLYVRLQARADVLNAYRSAIVQHAIVIARREFPASGPVHFVPADVSKEAA